MNLEALAKEIALSDFQSFIELIFPEFKISNHHNQMIDVIQKTITTPNGKAFIACPPRHSKSYLVSNLLAAYLMTKHRDFHFVVASYSSELSLELGRRTKQLFNSEIYQQVFSDVTISDDSSSKTRFHLSNGSSFFSVGVGGTLTGKSASILVLDDAYKGMEQAKSQMYQDNLKEWYASTFFTRRLKNAPMILINTLWTQKDLPLVLSEQEPDEWRVLKLKAITDNGLALWPEMFPIDALQSIKKTMGTNSFSALYQQEPAAEQGNLIKRQWLNKFWREMPARFDEIIQSWDMTFKGGDRSDYVVGQVWGRIGAEKWMLDQARFQGGFTETVAAVKSLSAKWPKAHLKLVEAKANGEAVIDSLKGQVSGIVGISPTDSKEARLNAVSPDFEAGNIILPDPSIAPWVHDYINELVGFPTARHDDCVDATTQGILRFREKSATLAKMTRM